MRGLIVCVSLFFLSNAQAYNIPRIPDPSLTPGALCTVDNPDFIGTPGGYMKCRRNVERPTKTAIYNEYDVPLQCRGHYTIDHFIPLSMGGSNSSKNLWPEHVQVKATRSQLELEVYEKLRARKITQRQAIDRIIAAKTSSELLKLPIIDSCGF